ncbi:MAG: Ig-like domain-containing protein, partial [Ginsengibacter sp.]
MKNLIFIAFIISLFSCAKKKNENNPQPPAPTAKSPGLMNISLDNSVFNSIKVNVSTKPVITLSFSEPVRSASTNAINISDNNGNSIPLSISLSNGDSNITIQPTLNLAYLSKYNFTVNTALQSASGGNLQTQITGAFFTKMDSSRKFPLISDDQLLDKIQQQTLKYFWDFA